MKSKNKVHLTNKNSKEICCKILFNQQEINEKIAQVAVRINDAYKNSNKIVLIGILKGAQRFIFQLMTNLKFDFEIDFLEISSYMGGLKPKRIQPLLTLETSIDLKDKNIILIDDIVESGKTITLAKDFLRSKNCASIKTVSFAKRKNSNNVANKFVDFYVFEVKNKFLIGYGFDLNGKYRDLDYVCYIGISSICCKLDNFFSGIKQKFCKTFCS